MTWWLIKELAPVVVASLLWWIKLHKAHLELQKAQMEIAELRRNERRRVLCAAIVEDVRNTKAQIDHPKNIVFSEHHFADVCNATEEEVADALAVLQAQGRAKRELAGSWTVYVS